MIKKKSSLIKMLVVFLLLESNVDAKQLNNFDKGLKLFENEKFEESKILFERDIVFYPKNERSYLYLAKIFKGKNEEEEEEINLNNVLLINPQNDEAIYMLALLKIKQSDYNHAKKLIDTFILVCKSFWLKKDEMQDKFKKLIPENAKDNN